jgi:hypothetical protein
LLQAAPEVAPVLVVGGMPEIRNFHPDKVMLLLSGYSYPINAEGSG